MEVGESAKTSHPSGIPAPELQARSAATDPEMNNTEPDANNTSSPQQEVSRADLEHMEVEESAKKSKKDAMALILQKWKRESGGSSASRVADMEHIFFGGEIQYCLTLWVSKISKRSQNLQESTWRL